MNRKNQGKIDKLKEKNSSEVNHASKKRSDNSFSPNKDNKEENVKDHPMQVSGRIPKRKKVILAETTNSEENFKHLAEESALSNFSNVGSKAPSLDVISEMKSEKKNRFSKTKMAKDSERFSSQKLPKENGRTTQSDVQTSGSTSLFLIPSPGNQRNQKRFFPIDGTLQVSDVNPVDASSWFSRIRHKFNENEILTNVRKEAMVIHPGDELCRWGTFLIKQSSHEGQGQGSTSEFINNSSSSSINSCNNEIKSNDKDLLISLETLGKVNKNSINKKSSYQIIKNTENKQDDESIAIAEIEEDPFSVCDDITENVIEEPVYYMKSKKKVKSILLHLLQIRMTWID